MGQGTDNNYDNPHVYSRQKQTENIQNIQEASREIDLTRSYHTSVDGVFWHLLNHEILIIKYPVAFLECGMRGILGRKYKIDRDSGAM